MMTEADKIRFHQQCAILARAKNAKLIPNVNCKDHFCLAMDLEYANDNGKKFKELLKKEAKHDRLHGKRK